MLKWESTGALFTSDRQPWTLLHPLSISHCRYYWAFMCLLIIAQSITHSNPAKHDDPPPIVHRTTIGVFLLIRYLRKRLDDAGCYPTRKWDYSSRRIHDEREISNKQRNQFRANQMVFEKIKNKQT